MLYSNVNKNSKYKNKGRLYYGTKDYSNPFFGQRRRESRRIAAFNDLGFQAKAITAGFVVLLLSLAWLFLYSPFFRFKSIEVNGGDRLPKEEIERLAWQRINDDFLVIWPHNNIFIFDEEALMRDLRKKYSFNSLYVDKKLPARLVINFEEKEYAFIWVEDGRYYYIDNTGFIVTETNPLDIKEKKYPVIDNMSGARIDGFNITAPSAYLSFVNKVSRLFSPYEDMGIEKYIIDEEIDAIKVKLLDGPVIHFNIKDDPEKQFNKLTILKDEKLKDEFKTKTYINLRFGDSIYFR